MGNLETPTDPAQSTEQGALGLYAFNSSPEMLENLPFDLLQLNNNHSLDAGNSGLEATIAEVESRGITYTGVNAHAEIQEIAFLSYTWGLNDPSVPTSHELFIVPFGHIGEDIDLSSIAEDIEQARAGGAQSVVVMLHWGFEYEYYPDPHFLVLAREIIASGADLIAGSGPHVVQPPELCYVNHPEVVPGVGTCSLQTEDGQPRMAAVLYSLGNFATTMATLPCQAGIAAMVTLNPDVTGLGWKGLVSVRGESGIEVVPLSKAEGEEVEAEAGRLEEHLGAGWKVH
jgi:poly-gamma-glutamate synthesis protein (capsule biosynthesis protein)